MVWALEATTDEGAHRCYTALRGDSPKLGLGTIGVLFSGAGQSYGLCGEWRCLLSDAAEGDTGGDINRCFYDLLGAIL